MHVPPAFRMSEAEALSLAAEIGFGALVSRWDAGPCATHLPFLIEPDRMRVLAHAARGNPQFAAPTDKALLIVQGPFAYVSPGFYPSKAEHGRVVPTWNYQAVHLKGGLRTFDEPSALLAVVEALTARHEAGRPAPWSVHDAPTDYMHAMINGIVGLELLIEEVAGVGKLSQNRSVEDQAGVRLGLSASRRPLDRAVAAEMKG